MGAVRGAESMRGRPGRRKLSRDVGGLIFGMLLPFPAPERLRRFEERDDAGETGGSATGLDWEVLMVELVFDGRVEGLFFFATVLEKSDEEVMERVGFSGRLDLPNVSDGAGAETSLLVVGLSSRGVWLLLCVLPPLRGRP